MFVMIKILVIKQRRPIPVTDNKVLSRYTSYSKMVRAERSITYKSKLDLLIRSKKFETGIELPWHIYKLLTPIIIKLSL